MIAAAVGAANCTDRDGLDALCGLNKARIQMLKKIYADLGYSGEDMRNRMSKYGIDIETIGRRCKKTFEVEPKRWIVERTFADARFIVGGWWCCTDCCGQRNYRYVAA